MWIFFRNAFTIAGFLAENTVFVCFRDAKFVHYDAKMRLNDAKVIQYVTKSVPYDATLRMFETITYAERAGVFVH